MNIICKLDHSKASGNVSRKTQLGLFYSETKIFYMVNQGYLVYLLHHYAVALIAVLDIRT